MLDSNFLQPERLRAFVAVVEMGSFSRAAEELGLAQPTISIQVRRLEETIGFSLLDRRSSTIALTREGEIMLGYARELLAVMKRARHQFSQPALEGTVRLGIAEDFNFTAFPEILGGMRQHHSRFELLLKMGSTADLHAQLRTSALDMLLSKRLTGGTDGEFICRQRMAWVGRYEVVEDGGAVSLVLTPPNTITREIVLGALRSAGRRWSIRCEAPTMAGLHAAVLAGVGITACGVGMIPAGLARLPDGIGLPPLADVEFTLGLNPDIRDPVVAAFAGVVRRLVPLIVARLEEEQGGASA